MLIAQGFWLFPPVVLGVAFDSIFLGNRPYRLPLVPATWIPETTMGQFWFSLGLFALAFFGGAAVYIIGSLAKGIATYRIQHALRIDAYTAVQSLDFGFFENQQTGEIMSILNNDVNQLEGFLSGTLQGAAMAAFIALIISVYMFLLNWQLALVAFSAPILVGAVNYWYSRYVEPKHQQRREEVGGINSRIQNNLGGMDLVKVYNRESYEEDRVTDASEAYKDVSWDVTRAGILFGQVSARLNDVGYVLIFLVGGYWVLNGPPLFFSGPMAAGTVLTFLIYSNRLSWPFQQVTSIVDSYQETKAAGGRVLGLLDESRSVPERPDVVGLSSADGAVEYDDVTFSYEGTNEASISSVSFDVDAGEMIGLVGPTGAGKSTLMKLLLRFYDVNDGAIRINGHDVRDRSLESLRRSIGYVGQEPYLFDGTVRENIAYSRPNADDADVEEAARRAGAHEFIRDLSKGYETHVGERGVKLSGGQRQRISIGRAVLDDPAILILDEATSHVDNETEAIIQNRLEDLVADRTTFAIAHRLSTVRHADQILVVEDGKVIERGTHEDLLEGDGLYANLWNVQVGKIDSLPNEFVQRVGVSNEGDAH
jgi:ATP-binding cassette subfamily B protein